MKIQSVRSSNWLLLAVTLLPAVALLMYPHPLNAQAPSSNALTVKLLDPIDSAQATAGQRFRAAVAKDTAVGGIFLAKGADATITLVPGTGGNRWTLNLIEVTANGKVAGVLGQNPTVVPTSAGDFLTMSKKAVATRDRIAVAAGENIRFILGAVSPSTSSAAQTAGAASPAEPVLRNASGAPPAAQTSDAPRAVGGDAPYVTKQGPAIGADVVVGAWNSDFQAYGVTLHLIGCARNKTASTACDFTYINHTSDRVVAIGMPAGWGALDGKGQVLANNGVIFAGGGRNHSDTVKDVLTYGRLNYAGADPDVSALKRVPIGLALLADDTHSPQNANFEWRAVGLAPAMSPAPEPPGPAANEIDYSGAANVAPFEGLGWRVTLMRCNRLAADPQIKHEGHTVMIECFFRLENLKADRDMILYGADYIDDRGREVGSDYNGNAAVGWTGNKTEYEHTTIVPIQYYRPIASPNRPQYPIVRPPTISYDDPQYFYAIFDTASPDAIYLPEIRFHLSTGANGGGIPYTLFDAVLRNVHFSHPPTPSAPAKKPAH